MLPASGSTSSSNVPSPSSSSSNTANPIKLEPGIGNKRSHDVEAQSDGVNGGLAKRVRMSQNGATTPNSSSSNKISHQSLSSRLLNGVPPGVPAPSVTPGALMNGHATPSVPPVPGAVLPISPFALMGALMSGAARGMVPPPMPMPMPGGGGAVGTPMNGTARSIAPNMALSRGAAATAAGASPSTHHEQQQHAGKRPREQQDPAAAEEDISHLVPGAKRIRVGATASPADTACGWCRKECGSVRGRQNHEYHAKASGHQRTCEVCAQRVCIGAERHRIVCATNLMRGQNPTAAAAGAVRIIDMDTRRGSNNSGSGSRISASHCNWCERDFGSIDARVSHEYYTKKKKTRRICDLCHERVCLTAKRHARYCAGLLNVADNSGKRDPNDTNCIWCKKNCWTVESRIAHEYYTIKSGNRRVCDKCGEQVCLSTLRHARHCRGQKAASAPSSNSNGVSSATATSSSTSSSKPADGYTLVLPDGSRNSQHGQNGVTTAAGGAASVSSLASASSSQQHGVHPHSQVPQAQAPPSSGKRRGRPSKYQRLTTMHCSWCNKLFQSAESRKSHEYHSRRTEKQRICPICQERVCLGRLRHAKFCKGPVPGAPPVANNSTQNGTSTTALNESEMQDAAVPPTHATPIVSTPGGVASSTPNTSAVTPPQETNGVSQSSSASLAPHTPSPGTIVGLTTAPGTSAQPSEGGEMKSVAAPAAATSGGSSDAPAAAKSEPEEVKPFGRPWVSGIYICVVYVYLTSVL